MSEQGKVLCPKCKSDQVSAMKKGFSGGKAVAGALVTGGIGVLAGTHGSNKLMAGCLNCGATWDPAEVYKKEKEKQQAQEVNKLKVWKRSWYNHYEKNDFERSTQIFLAEKSFNKKTPDIHSAYKAYKKTDTYNTITAIVFLSLLLWLFYIIFF